MPGDGLSGGYSQDPATVVSYVEQELTRGQHNMTTCPETPAEIETRFIAAGWRHVVIDRGKFLLKGDWLCFTRSQGRFGDTIIQWRCLRSDDEIREQKSQPTLFDNQEPQL